MRGSSDPQVSDPIRAPHELAADVTVIGQRMRVGGRIFWAGPSVRLADAWSAIDLDLVDPAPPHGTIAVVEGVLDGVPSSPRLVSARVITRQEPLRSGLSPEFERLFQHGVGRNLLTRARVIQCVRGFFQARGFLEVDTPLRTGERVPEPHIEPLTCSGGYLITSPELHMKRLLVAGVPRMFQLSHCFRDEELGPLHSPEFAMLEWYRAFAPYSSVMADTEELLHQLCREIMGSSELRMPQGERIDLTPPFIRCTVREAFAEHAGVADAAALAERDENRYFQLLVDQVEPALSRVPRPVFLYEYPASQAALARRCPHDPAVAERFELYLGGVELCNGYGELSDASEQRQRCELEGARRRAAGRPVPALPSRFLESLEYGMPEASGNAVGLERVIALLCGEARIDSVCPFPEAIV